MCLGHSCLSGSVCLCRDVRDMVTWEVHRTLCFNWLEAKSCQLHEVDNLALMWAEECCLWPVGFTSSSKPAMLQLFLLLFLFVPYCGLQHLLLDAACFWKVLPMYLNTSPVSPSPSPKVNLKWSLAYVGLNPLYRTHAEQLHNHPP